MLLPICVYTVSCLCRYLPDHCFVLLLDVSLVQCPGPAGTSLVCMLAVAMVVFFVTVYVLPVTLAYHLLHALQYLP